MTNKKKLRNNSTFKSTVQALESIVEKLENQETTLEESLEAFESGIDLTRKAQKSLSQAEQKVRVLSEINGDPVGDNSVPGKETG